MSADTQVLEAVERLRAAMADSEFMRAEGVDAQISDLRTVLSELERLTKENTELRLQDAANYARWSDKAALCSAPTFTEADTARLRIGIRTAASAAANWQEEHDAALRDLADRISRTLESK